MAWKNKQPASRHGSGGNEKGVEYPGSRAGDHSVPTTRSKWSMGRITELVNGLFSNPLEYNLENYMPILLKNV